MTRRITLAAVVAALLTPGAAQAGTPFTLGPGSSPHIATEPGGTAHVVWIHNGDTALRYCRVLRGSTACDGGVRTLTPPAGPPTGFPDDPYIAWVSATDLRIVMPVYASNGTYQWTSGDNGTTWGPAQQIYDDVTSIGTTSSEPFVVPAGGFAPGSVVFGTSGRVVYRSDGAVDGARDAGVQLGGTGGTDFEVAPTPDGRVVAAGHDGGNAQSWVTNGGDPELAPSWAVGPTPIGSTFDEMQLAGGPGGAYLFASTGTAADPRQEIRRFDTVANAFGPPTVLAQEVGYINDVTVGPTGAVAAIWRRNESSNGNRLQLALSADGNVFGVTTIAREDSVMADMNVSLAADNAGWASWESFGSGADAQIRLADLTTVPDPVVAPPIAAPAPPVAAPKPATTPKPAAKTKKTTVSVKGATITLQAPRQCIPPGRPFVATLSWKKQRRKGNLFVKVRRTDFYIGSRRLRIDKKAPFRQTLRIPNPKKGQSYRLRARAFIKVKRGKAPKKSVVTTLRVCA